MTNTKTYNDKYSEGYGIQFPEGHIIRAYNNFIKELLPKSDKKLNFLDFGCGNGIHSKYFASKGFDVYGVDIAEQAIDQAKRNNLEHQENFRLISNNNLSDVVSTKFDLILANQSLYYLNDDELKNIVEQFYNELNKDGIVLFTMMSSKNYYYENIEESLSNGLSKVVLTGRLNEKSYVNFTKNFDELKKKFSLFMPLYCGIYDMTMLEGSSEHMFFVGIKKY